MSWLGAASPHSGWFAPMVFDEPTNRSALEPTALMPKGTLMVEARLTPEDGPQTLLAFNWHHPWSGSFALRCLPGGSIVIVEDQGGEVRSAVLPYPYSDRSDLVRICYSWNGPGKIGRLSVERPEPDTLRTVDFAAARPMVVGDLRSMILHPLQREMDRDVMQVAVSDEVEPLGPTPSLTGRTLILTNDGEKQVRDIRRGDLVRTHQGDLVPVLQVVKRVVPAHGGFRPIKLRAGYFGLKRDIVVAPDQRIVMSGSDVEYMFGKQAVSVPARHLVNDRWAITANGPNRVEYFQLVLPNHEVIMASGCALESLYVGRIRRHPEKFNVTLLTQFDRSTLPEHASPAWPVLKPFEAITLASSRAA